MEEERVPTENRVVKMQKLRRAVDRLRGLRSGDQVLPGQPSLWARFKASLLLRLGLGPKNDTPTE